jgi:hypothetical protein
MTATAAKPTSPEGSHWYYPDGKPCYEIQAKNGNMRATTLADARKLGLVPSVTTILKVLHKQGLVNWLIEQACLSVLTSPRLPGEELDSFVDRILHKEKVQEEEGQIAKDRGNDMHGALETAYQGGVVEDNELWKWVSPAYKEISQRGVSLHVECCLVGDGYAGRVDLIQESDDLWVWDWKTTKKLPTKGAWTEHVLQAAAYAAALARRGTTGNKRIRTGNVYISTVAQGEFLVCEHPEWQGTYENGFQPLVKVWQFLNDYRPGL